MAYKLLLADDSITIQKVVELVLAEEGFEINAANNGEEALSAVVSFKPDVILADIEMPKMNGYPLCEEIKTNPETKHIPIIRSGKRSTLSPSRGQTHAPASRHP